SYLTLSIPHLGPGSICLSPSAGGDAACRCVKKIWLVRSVASGYSVITRRIASLGWFDCGPIARQHHLCWARHHREEAPRLDAWLFERDAHGLYFSRNCERHDPLRDR